MATRLPGGAEARAARGRPETAGTLLVVAGRGKAGTILTGAGLPGRPSARGAILSGGWAVFAPGRAIGRRALAVGRSPAPRALTASSPARSRLRRRPTPVVSVVLRQTGGGPVFLVRVFRPTPEGEGQSGLDSDPRLVSPWASRARLQAGHEDQQEHQRSNKLQDTDTSADGPVHASQYASERMRTLEQL